MAQIIAGRTGSIFRFGSTSSSIAPSSVFAAAESNSSEPSSRHISAVSCMAKPNSPRPLPVVS